MQTAKITGDPIYLLTQHGTFRDGVAIRALENLAVQSDVMEIDVDYINECSTAGTLYLNYAGEAISGPTPEDSPHARLKLVPTGYMHRDGGELTIAFRLIDNVWRQTCMGTVPNIINNCVSCRDLNSPTPGAFILRAYRSLRYYQGNFRLRGHTLEEIIENNKVRRSFEESLEDLLTPTWGVRPGILFAWIEKQQLVYMESPNYHAPTQTSNYIKSPTGMYVALEPVLPQTAPPEIQSKPQPASIPSPPTALARELAKAGFDFKKAPATEIAAEVNIPTEPETPYEFSQANRQLSNRGPLDFKTPVYQTLQHLGGEPFRVDMNSFQPLLRTPWEIGLTKNPRIFQERLKLYATFALTILRDHSHDYCKDFFTMNRAGTYVMVQTPYGCSAFKSRRIAVPLVAGLQVTYLPTCVAAEALGFDRLQWTFVYKILRVSRHRAALTFDVSYADFTFGTAIQDKVKAGGEFVPSSEIEDNISAALLRAEWDGNYLAPIYNLTTHAIDFALPFTREGVPYTLASGLAIVITRVGDSWIFCRIITAAAAQINTSLLGAPPRWLGNPEEME